MWEWKKLMCCILIFHAAVNKLSAFASGTPFRFLLA